MKKANFEKFDTLSAGDASLGIFGLPFTREESNIVVIPVPWEVTTSYGRGTVNGPESIWLASPQLDLFSITYANYGLPNPWHYGIFMPKISEEVLNLNKVGCELSLPIIAVGGAMTEENKGELLPALREVNLLSEKLNAWVAKETKKVLQEGKIPVVLGGDHASPFGAIQQLAAQYPGLGILHVDAHADLRAAYEGFEYSHASIFNNVIHKIPNVGKLVQVGIRDFSEEEFVLSKSHPKIETFFDIEVEKKLADGTSWKQMCAQIVNALPEHVYISFDIDGLNPALCPNTGTPVPGGLSFFQAQSLIEELVIQKKQIVGADLCEVAPKEGGSDEWDANVGARILYAMCSAILCSKL